MNSALRLRPRRRRFKAVVESLGHMKASRRHLIRLTALAPLLALAAKALAQIAPRPPTRDIAQPSTLLPPGQGGLSLSAALAGGSQPLKAGLQWRIVQERAENDGSHVVVANSNAAAPVIAVPDGDYIVHVAFGLASAMKRVTINGRLVTERLPLNAGALKITGMLGDVPIPPTRLKIAVYVPERGATEARVVVENARPGEVIRLPEGNYRVVSTYLEKETAGSTPAPGVAANATNSVVNADLRIQAGKLTEGTLRHRAALLTLKLVNAPNGEALANTSFSVLTPGGDVIREMIGAFPSVVLAEGEYVVIARRNGRTWQATFKVQSNLDRDVEVVAN